MRADIHYGRATRSAQRAGYRSPDHLIQLATHGRSIQMVHVTTASWPWTYAPYRPNLPFQWQRIVHRMQRACNALLIYPRFDAVTFWNLTRTAEVFGAKYP